jgi:hypothetical protein
VIFVRYGFGVLFLLEFFWNFVGFFCSVVDLNLSGFGGMVVFGRLCKGLLVSLSRKERFREAIRGFLHLLLVVDLGWYLM